MENSNFKPECSLLGSNDNFFVITGLASRTLKENNLKKKAREMWDRAMESGSCEAALKIIGEYVTIIEEKPEQENESFHNEDGLKTTEIRMK